MGVPNINIHTERKLVMTQANVIAQAKTVSEGQLQQRGNLYADQVVQSNYGYSSGYRSARPIEEQIEILKACDCWGREIDWTLNKKQWDMLFKIAPECTEGYFAVVFDKTMVTHYEESLDIDQSAPINRVLDALLKKHGKEIFHSTRMTDELKPKHYRRNVHSAVMMKKLWKLQGKPTGIMLIPAQLGIKHAGESDLRSKAILCGNEFPLDANETLQMILTHENRLNNYHDLWINLPGSEFSARGDGKFISSLTISFDFNLVFSCCVGPTRYINDRNGRYGSASGFIPWVKSIP